MSSLQDSAWGSRVLDDMAGKSVICVRVPVERSVHYRSTHRGLPDHGKRTAKSEPSYSYANMNIGPVIPDLRDS